MSRLWRLSSLAACMLSALTMSPAAVAEPVIAGGIKGELAEQLLEAFQSLDDSYEPRTEHFDDNGDPRYLNRLVREASPYLLQHAHNPVNWYPWGAEAFEAAKAQDKPIFLSIGYATCHWCHVMERESFENEAIAEILNENFIAIKVDREQRPDVDSTYMTAVQMLTGGGGWPLSSFLNPGSQPFHGGTYFPPDVFTDLLNRVTQVWGDSRQQLDEQAEQISAALATATNLSDKVRELGDRDIMTALSQLMTRHDSQYGGFGGAPKFPSEPSLVFLLDQAKRTADKGILDAATFTLQRIAAGGIHDQVGGGFHRYATDTNWLIPHFEKMLYNQAGLSSVYTDAWLLTGDPEYLRITRRTLDYVLREMTSPEGMFYSATDADSGEGEGEFFIWTPDELNNTLSAEDAALAIKAWNVTEAGNFEHRNILHHTGPLSELADSMDMSLDSLSQKLDEISAVLLSERQKREAPLLDDKVITAWNGMMINALAKAGDAFGNQDYIDAARKAADRLIVDNQRVQDGEQRLWRAKFNGNWSVNAGQADYAFLAEALVTLFDVTGESRYLDKAESLIVAMNSDFLDTEIGGYFMGSAIAGGAVLPTRPKDLYDNAFPSGNAAAARTLVKLWRRTGIETYRDTALSLFGAFSEAIARAPSGFPYLLTALSEMQDSETGDRQYGAKGNVLVKGQINNDSIEVAVTIADGWHINAHQPLQDYLIGTTLLDALARPVDGAVYPAEKRAVLGFERSELALYDEQILISAPIPESTLASIGKTMPVALKIQACNDKVCLAPETIVLNLSTAKASNL